eukprot:CAMPEP_0194245872 /NCGR_PEP_ID=MMETSP0158-20130606/14041_1 /TAXON_ID=33649 /ORGANISM="Thalassionema nitzschioides, Strain L26-B" /LENGTH=348 /DNA_ID=CAMNT_0038981663 /DNA_START=261 /DNA_END=1307 /DNA_ORIENTATION=-
MAKSMNNLSPYIDWNRLEDEYIHAKLDSETRHRRLSNHQRRHRRSHNIKKVVGNVVGSATGFVASRPKGAGSRPKQEQKPGPSTKLDALLNGALKDAEKVMPPVRKDKPSKVMPPVREDNPSFLNHLDAYISNQMADGLFETEAKQIDDNLGKDDGSNRQELDEGIPIPVYSYSPCENTVDALPCAPDNLKDLCTKGATVTDNNGNSVTSSFTACFDACEPSFCCIHDAPPETNAPAQNCNQNPNCAEYAYCYIVWWKFHNTAGPATELRLEGNDDFYDVDADEVPVDVTGLDFFQKLLFHHFDNYDEIVAAGTVENPDGSLSFSSDLIFLDPNFWDSEFRIKDIPMN